MLLTDIHPLYRDHIDFLEGKKSVASLWQTETAAVTQRARAGASTADEAMDILHHMQRLRKIHIAGLENTPDFREAFDRAGLSTWSRYTSPPIEEELQQALADQVYNAKAGDKAILQVADGARQVGDMLVAKCMQNSIPTFVEVADVNFKNLLLKHASDAAIEKLAEDYLQRTDPVNKRIAALAGQSDETPVEKDFKKDALYSKGIKRYSTRLRTGDLFYTMTMIPTRKDAQADGMDFEPYTRQFFEMCHQPWPHVERDQALFIERELNPGNCIHFTNRHGTDVWADIEGFTYCNSVTLKNVPGSEMFSAPRIDSMNGRIVSKGLFCLPNDPSAIIENLTLEFDHGRLVRWHADRGQHYFDNTVDNKDDPSNSEGMRHVGEIGIGTNPHLRRHVVNPLLVEKVSGSFHIALGDAYQFTSYAGKPVHVDNGNRGNPHFDITTLLGNIYIDGREVMKNGRFKSRDYDVLNYGWAAIPEAERPDYWKKHPSVLANLDLMRQL